MKTEIEAEHLIFIGTWVVIALVVTFAVKLIIAYVIPGLEWWHDLGGLL
jgi:hypothetical protein